MAYKLAFLLSLFYVAEIMCYGGDLCRLQSLYSTMDAVCVLAGEKIARSWNLTSEVQAYVANALPNGTIESLTPAPYAEGDIYTFKVISLYDPLVIKKEPFTVTIVRSIVLGYSE